MISNFDSMNTVNFSGGEGGRWNSGGVVKKRQSPDFRFPEVGISETVFSYLT